MPTVDHAPPRNSSARGPSPKAGFFQALVENSPDTIFLIDLETEECIYVSPAVRSLLGCEPGAMIGRPLTDFVHPDDAIEVLARSAARREGRGVQIGGDPHVAPRSRLGLGSGHSLTDRRPRRPGDRDLHRNGSFGAGARGTRPAERQAPPPRLLDRVGGGETGVLLQTSDGTYDLTVETLASALELRDDETGQHARRVTNFALALTQAIDPELASEPDLRYGFLLHDIGKIGVPDAILLKRGSLTEREARVLQMHTTR
jgi:HD-GYP domain-containing protein (c-di-GMP phosphodiesterase class II)